MIKLSESNVQKWVFGLAALAAVVIGVLDFTPLITIASDQVQRMILIALGLTMGVISVQTSKRAAEMKELHDILGTVSAELIETQRDFELHSKQSATRAKQFILHTRLSADNPMMLHPYDNMGDRDKTIFERVVRKEISYHRIETISNKERLEFVIFRLLIYGGTDYRVRYYDTLIKPIPILNLMSIDNEEFYLGGFYISDAPFDTSSAVCIRNRQMGHLFKSYWDNLWFSAKPLNEGGRINWEELWVIAKRVGMAKGDFDNMIARLKKEVEYRKSEVK